MYTETKKKCNQYFSSGEKSRYCLHSDAVDGVWVVVGVGICDKLGHNFFPIHATFMKLHALVHHHKGYNLTKGNNSRMSFD